jgi:hypothetical protein
VVFRTVPVNFQKGNSLATFAVSAGYGATEEQFMEKQSISIF